MWRCEDCHYHQAHQEDLARELKWEDEVNRVEDEIFDDTNQVAGPLAEARAMIVDAVRAREEYENETLTLKRGEQMDEVQWVEQWTWQYGRLLFELKYDPAVDRELTDGRKGYLLSVKVWDLLVMRDVTRTKDVLNAEILRYREMVQGYPEQLHPLLDMSKSPEPEGRGKAAALGAASTTNTAKGATLTKATDADADIEATGAYATSTETTCTEASRAEAASASRARTDMPPPPLPLRITAARAARAQSDMPPPPLPTRSMTANASRPRTDMSPPPLPARLTASSSRGANTKEAASTSANAT